ncbi:MAG TPA: RNA-binding cell elongation regulator Jag/EloR [Thermomicrobiales bacterium]|jgi:spoIIIJ-associated protein|nr:RNA-binding cell elongation regulator Jag/EloR [Thermomicrobiales bacterium]
MTSVEIQAYSVEAAVRLALEQLDLTEDQVDIEILSDVGPDEDAEALVRVTAKGMASQPEVHGVDRHDGHRHGDDRHAGRHDRGRRALGDRPSSRTFSDHGGRPGRPDPNEPETGEIYQRLRDQMVPSPRADPEAESVAVEVTAELLDVLGIDARVEAIENLSVVPLDDDDPRTIFLDIIGSDLGLLIGRRGENLGQLQYLVTLLVNRRLPGFNRVILDVAGYRLRREESLIGLAERVARQVARTRRPVALDPMPANERRVIHMVLRPHPDVSTESSGEGTMRRITVLPRG